MIPKIIHYCWFGRGPKSELIQRCMDSWKAFCPYYEIIEWNEDNYDINSMAYTKEAYTDKKWAFVSDVARLYAVEKYGGMYMDTDVEILGPLDSFMQDRGFFLFESALAVNTGKGFGAEKGDPLVRAMLTDYENRSLYDNSHKISQLCTHINTDFIKSSLPAFECNNKLQNVEGYKFYPYEISDKYLHHYNSLSWTDRKPLKRRKHSRVVMSILKRLRNVERISWIKRHLGEKAGKIYIFLVFDAFDTPPTYFMKRIFKR